MEEKLLLKMLDKSFQQYGRDLTIDPLNEKEKKELIKEAVKQQQADSNSKWFEIIEDIVYEYVTNQEII
ncbi:YqzH family protein [Metabacillus fastidiosus]|uniref:YqzH family protein n=1 Tax=Metabacillus fastidiosus TaxID=1458 RepID=UPI002DBF3A90|nr:YqzH family protein [Metabacillus fastidiosus]MEC2075789.1 YqzH family protein [Metabacillus fastidiosus]